MAEPNKLYVSDNLPVMAGMPDASVDLIYADPPFKSDKLRKSSSKTKDLSFDDTWSQKEFDFGAATPLRQRHPEVWDIMDIAKKLHGNAMYNYLIFMASRLAEMHRILKPAGSLYLHCDPHASYYLRLLLDCFFGKNNFRNEIVWHRKLEKQNAGIYKMGAVHDVIFWYVRSAHTKPSNLYTDYDENYITETYRYEDARGRYATFPCTHATGGREYEFKGITRPWRFKQSRMQKMYDDDLLVQHRRGSAFRYKKYLHDGKGVLLQDLWMDIKPVRGKESTKWATQKPLALLRRIIAASSDEGDVVFDPFCGCATTCLAATELNRRWIGIDQKPETPQILRERFKQNEITHDFDLDEAGAQVAPKPKRAPKKQQFPDAMSPAKARPILIKRDLELFGKTFCKGCMGAHTESQNGFGLEVDHIRPKDNGGPTA